MNSDARVATITVDGKQYTLVPNTLGDYRARERYIHGLKKDPFEVLQRRQETLACKPLAQLDQVQAELRECTAELQKEKTIAVAVQRLGKSIDALAEAVASQTTTLATEAERAWKRAMAPAVVSIADEMAFDQSMHGIAYRVWRAMQVHHSDEFDSDPEKGVQQALDWIEKVGNARFRNIVELLEGPRSQEQQE